MKKILFLLFFLFSINPVYAKTIHAHLAKHIRGEPVIIRGIVIKINKIEFGCSIKILNETDRNDVLKINGKCPKNLRKGERVFGTFDGENFVFMRRRDLLK